MNNNIYITSYDITPRLTYLQFEINYIFLNTYFSKEVSYNLFTIGLCLNLADKLN